MPVALNLNDLVIELDSMLRRLIGEDVELVAVTSPTLAQSRPTQAKSTRFS
jgi:hypothetical protein